MNDGRDERDQDAEEALHVQGGLRACVQSHAAHGASTRLHADRDPFAKRIQET